MSLRWCKLSVHSRKIIHAFCCFNIRPLLSDIETHDSRIVEDLILKITGNRHAKDTFRNGSNGSLCNGNEAYHHEAQTDLNIKFSGGIHIFVLRYLSLEFSFHVLVINFLSRCIRLPSRELNVQRGDGEGES